MAKRSRLTAFAVASLLYLVTAAGDPPEPAQPSPAGATQDTQTNPAATSASGEHPANPPENANPSANTPANAPANASPPAKPNAPPEAPASSKRREGSSREGTETSNAGSAAHRARAEHPAAARPAARPAPVRPVAPREPFSFQAVQHMAQDRAAKAYRERSGKLPEVLAKLTFDQYGDIRFRRASALWYDHAMFEVQFFHRGFTYDRRVNIYEVVNNAVRAVPYNPAMFEFGKKVPPVKLPAELGFAGFRVHYPLNTPAYKDEVLVFLGASYFRLLARNETYGISARGLAVNTATEAGEEFPYFTDFWLVRPEPNQHFLTIYALLDSPSVTGAYQFELHPGSASQMKVSAELYPRKAIDKLGIGAMTSMYLYGENSTRHFDDYRPEVHDSDGLMTETGTGEWAWRPLVNPRSLRVNRFMDEHPRGYGLSQRDRDPTHYQDIDSHFYLRPSYWIEPQGDWGKGGVELVEIPTDEQIHDNVVAYWVPETAVQPHKPFSFAYVLSAYSHSHLWPPGGRVIATRTGAAVPGTAGQSAATGPRRVVIDFAGGDLDDLYAAQPVQAQISSTNGDVDEVRVERVPQTAIWRVSFRMKPAGEKPVDLRCFLTLYGEALTETWTYLWKPSGGA